MVEIYCLGRDTHPPTLCIYQRFDGRFAYYRCPKCGEEYATPSKKEAARQKREGDHAQR